MKEGSIKLGKKWTVGYSLSKDWDKAFERVEPILHGDHVHGGIGFFGLTIAWWRNATDSDYVFMRRFEVENYIHEYECGNPDCGHFYQTVYRFPETVGRDCDLCGSRMYSFPVYIEREEKFEGKV